MHYSFFITNGHHLILLQSSADNNIGRFVRVVDKNGVEKFCINLDLAKFGLSLEGLLGMCADRGLLMVWDDTKILSFHISSGIFLGQLPIWPHFETSFCKDNQLYASIMDQSEYYDVVFYGSKLVLTHAPQKRFPSVVDIFKFW